MEQLSHRGKLIFRFRGSANSFPKCLHQFLLTPAPDSPIFVARLPQPQTCPCYLGSSLVCISLMTKGDEDAFAWTPGAPVLWSACPSFTGFNVSFWSFNLFPFYHAHGNFTVRARLPLPCHWTLVCTIRVTLHVCNNLTLGDQGWEHHPFLLRSLWAPHANLPTLSPFQLPICTCGQSFTLPSPTAASPPTWSVSVTHTGLWSSMEMMCRCPAWSLDSCMLAVSMTSLPSSWCSAERN